MYYTKSVKEGLVEAGLHFTKAVELAVESPHLTIMNHFPTLLIVKRARPRLYLFDGGPHFLSQATSFH